MSFTDVFDAIILTGLETLIEAEFTNDEKVYVAEEFEDYGFRLNPVETDHLTRPNAGESRTYSVEVTYYVDAKPGRNRIKHLLAVFDRFNRKIGDNNVYRVSGTYKWHDANLGMTNFGPDEEGRGQFRTIFTCTYVEGY